MTPLLLDTAMLAADLDCTPAYVRLLVHAGVITPVARIRLRATGRPSMVFDAERVDEQIAEAARDGRVRLDGKRPVLRNSRSS